MCAENDKNVCKYVLNAYSIDTVAFGLRCTKKDNYCSTSFGNF